MELLKWLCCGESRKVIIFQLEKKDSVPQISTASAESKLIEEKSHFWTWEFIFFHARPMSGLTGVALQR
jgi:hypothetical protein